MLYSLAVCRWPFRVQPTQASAKLGCVVFAQAFQIYFFVYRTFLFRFVQHIPIHRTRIYWEAAIVSKPKTVLYSEFITRDNSCVNSQHSRQALRRAGPAASQEQAGYAKTYCAFSQVGCTPVSTRLDFFNRTTNRNLRGYNQTSFRTCPGPRTTFHLIARQPTDYRHLFTTLD